jgi:hypothetical protein
MVRQGDSCEPFATQAAERAWRAFERSPLHSQGALLPFRQQGNAGEETIGAMQRVRIGLTGLAFVFLLVLLAAIFVRPSAETPITANAVEQMANGVDPALAANEGEPKEPLAELGVAPGNADTNTAAPAAGSQAKKQ